MAALVSGAYDRLVRKLIEEPRRPDLEAWSHQIQELFARGLFTDEARVVLDREVNKDGALRGATESGPFPVVQDAGAEAGGAAAPPRGRRRK
jgi:hypothetical protein